MRGPSSMQPTRLRPRLCSANLHSNTPNATAEWVPDLTSCTRRLAPPRSRSRHALILQGPRTTAVRKVVTEGAWKALHAFYGLQGPPLPRKVIEIDGRVELEMYPLRLHVHRTDKAGQVLLMERVLQISRAATGGEAKQVACKLHGLSDEASEIVLCHSINDDLEAGVTEVSVLIPKAASDVLSKTLHVLHFLDGHQLLLRYRGVQQVSLGRNSLHSNAGKNHGHVGLQNLGNTCYMNASIQCLVHSPFLSEYFQSAYLYDVNLASKWGMAGKLAIAFADLFQDMHEARTQGLPLACPSYF
eukprot:s594_g8.t2